ncbi:MAG TPA: nucleoside triphosphate pyrophosphohydrolase [Methyloceanibacter sp.]|jgi:MazG family protein|nr:nucleoside triphosphate pyrophosphohydrolase [Methyloceanibacter sp.]
MSDGPEKRYTLDDLLAVMARLRDKDAGCPWDIAQSFGTIAPYTIEEAYEVADAIAREDLDALKEELGDLLLQVAYHAQMASEERRFGFDDVVDTITRKMVRRHPHVFGEASRDEFLTKNMWGRIKEAEKAERGSTSRRSRFDDVPLALPALARAVKLQKRAAEVGFDWPSVAPVVAKAEEELTELKGAVAARDESDRGPATRAREELGDLLFAVANIARHLGVDPEAALRDANAKFLRRFATVEEALAKDGRKAEDATLEEMDRLWDEAKAAERKI